jgi:oligopeptide transport system permease protein
VTASSGRDPSVLPTDPGHAVTHAGVVPTPERGTSLGADAWRRLRRNKVALVGLVLIVLIVLLCWIGPLILQVDPQKTDPRLGATDPSAEHWLGTDTLGRDYLARVLVGGQTSLLVGLVATLACILVGTLYGAVSGYYGGRIDDILMRFVDFFYGIPYMFLVVLIMLMFDDAQRGNPVPVFLALGLVQWLGMARVVRGQVLALRDQEFVLAARLTGASDGRIILRHILPNVLGIVIIYATLTVPAVIILESFLSFLGLGVDLSWGRLVSEAVGVVNPLKSYWWLLLWPSVFLAVTLFSLNFLGDGLRDAFDPKSRR